MQQQPTATMFEPARNGNGGTLQLVNTSITNMSSAGNLSQSSQKRTVMLKKKRRNKPANLDTIDAVHHSSGMLPMMIHGNS